MLVHTVPEIYEHELVPAMYGVWAPFVVDLTQPKRGERVLDAHCRTGLITRLAAQKVGTPGEVVAIDNDPSMLSVARAGARVSGAAPIEWDEGTIMALPYEDEAFEVVYSVAALQSYPNRAQVLHEFYRVLDLHGRLGMLLWRDIEHSPGFAALADALDRFVSHDAAMVIREQFSLCDANEIYSLLRGASFRDIKVDPTSASAMFHSSEHFMRTMVMGTGLSRYLAQVDQESRQAVFTAVCAALKPYTSPDGVAFPMAAHLISARK
jgi:ubiquinone/menaquinone biosynthesis C-methylase UbiE